jgi:ATP-dependent HslUV protease subunit HslV
MTRLATSLGIRKSGRTVIGVIGPSSTLEGTSIRVFRDDIRRTSDCGFAWVSVGTEGEVSLLGSVLQNLRAAHGDNLNAVAIHMARSWLVDESLRSVHEPVLLATSDRLLRVGPQGDVVEPSDGVAAIGYSSGMVMGAAKALLAHTSLDGEQIVRESLQFAADGRFVTGAGLIVKVL